MIEELEARFEAAYKSLSKMLAQKAIENNNIRAVVLSNGYFGESLFLQPDGSWLNKIHVTLVKVSHDLDILIEVYASIVDIGYYNIWLEVINNRADCKRLTEYCENNYVRLLQGLVEELEASLAKHIKAFT